MPKTFLTLSTRTIPKHNYFKSKSTDKVSNDTIRKIMKKKIKELE